MADVPGVHFSQFAFSGCSKTLRRWTCSKNNNRLVTGLLLIGLVALGLAVSIALPILIPVFRFPHPTGLYAIGTLSYHWVGHDRPVVLYLPLIWITVVN